MKGFIPPGVEALAADEHDAAVNALKAAEALGTRLEKTELQVCSYEMDLGKLLSVIRENQRWTLAIRGMKFEEWTRKNFKTRDGKPMKADVAKRLAQTYLLISKYPEVEKAVRQGTLDAGLITNRTSAYYACRIAELSGWHAEEVEKFLASAEIDATVSERASAHASAAVQARILKLLQEKSSTDLRADYTILKIEVGGGSRPEEYVRLNSPVVTKAVFENTEEILGWLASLNDEQERDVRAMRPTSILERLAGFAGDVKEAFEQEAMGNPLPLESLRTIIRSKGRADA